MKQKNNRREFLNSMICVALLSTISNPVAAKSNDRNSIIEGNGMPSLVFIHGLDSDIFVSFKKITPLLSPIYTVAGFNRKGYGGVKYSNEERSGKVIAQEIYQNLRENNIKPPYIIVGHSLGGVYAEFFAKMYPQETAGMLLIDPMIEGQLEFLRSQYPDAISMMNLIMAFKSKPIRKEYEFSGKLHTQLKSLPAFNGKTLVLYSNTVQGLPNPDAFIAYRRQVLTELAKSYNTQLRVFNSGHFIQNEQPQDVVNAINEIAMVTVLGR